MESFYKVKTITAPTEYPVTVSEAKEQANITHEDDNALILRLIAAATNYVENYCSIAIVRQQKRMFFTRFYDVMSLPFGPVQSIQQIKYVDIDGATQTLSTDVYDFNTVENCVFLAYGKTWPATRAQQRAVYVDYWAGYYEPTESPIDQTVHIPEALKHAILMLVSELDKNREAANELATYKNKMFDAILSPFREFF